jgi:hypothetical protein
MIEDYLYYQSIQYSSGLNTNILTHLAKRYLPTLRIKNS